MYTETKDAHEIDFVAEGSFFEVKYKDTIEESMLLPYSGVDISMVVPPNASITPAKDAYPEIKLIGLDRVMLG
jgi:hypothetical protein